MNTCNSELYVLIKVLSTLVEQVSAHGQYHMYLCGLCFFQLSQIFFSFHDFTLFPCCLMSAGNSKTMLFVAYNTVQYLGYMGKWVPMNFKTGYKVLCLKVHVNSVTKMSHIF